MALELAYSVQTVAKMMAEVSRGSPAKRRQGQREIILIGFHKHHLAVTELKEKIVMSKFQARRKII